MRRMPGQSRKAIADAGCRFQPKYLHTPPRNSSAAFFIESNFTQKLSLEPYTEIAGKRIRKRVAALR